MSRKLEGMKVTTLYLPEDLIIKAKARGINISEAVREYLKVVLADEEQYQLEELEKEITQLEKELYKLKAQRETIIKRREEKLKKENRETVIRNTLEQIKTLNKLINEAAGTKEETEYRIQIEKAYDNLILATGLTFGSDEWKAVIRALNKKGVEAAVKEALKWNT